MAVTELPTREGLPLAIALLFVSLFIIVSRRKAITQVIGFLMRVSAILVISRLLILACPAFSRLAMEIGGVQLTILPPWYETGEAMCIDPGNGEFTFVEI